MGGKALGSRKGATGRKTQPAPAAREVPDTNRSADRMPDPGMPPPPVPMREMTIDQARKEIKLPSDERIRGRVGKEGITIERMAWPKKQTMRHGGKVRGRA